MNYTIRKADKNDIDNGLLELFIDGYNIHQTGRPDIFGVKTNEELKFILNKSLDNIEETFLLILEGEKIIGYLSYKIKGEQIKRLWIDEFVIDKNYRSNGYGNTLLKELEKICKENNYKSIELNCWAFNEKALEFYKNNGYKESRIVFEKNIY